MRRPPRRDHRFEAAAGHHHAHGALDRDPVVQCVLELQGETFMALRTEGGREEALDEAGVRHHAADLVVGPFMRPVVVGVE
jgi:hypothetical protein